MTLENINLEIKSGETIGIIGGTGSSKTTLVQLIKMNNIQNPVYIFTRRIVSPFQDLIIDYPFATGFKTLNIQNIINSRIIKTVNELIYEQTGKLLEQGYNPLK